MRLKGQLKAVWQVMRGGKWRKLEDVAGIVGCPATSASARLRDLRKREFGRFDIDKKYNGCGEWLYRLRRGRA